MNLHMPPARPLPPSLDILGVAVVPLAWDEAIGLVHRLVEDRTFTRIGFLNAHNANTACTDEQFRQTLKTFLVLPDGVGMDIAAKLLYGRPFPANLNGTDFVPALFETGERSLTIGLLGTTRPNAEAAAARLSARMPRHRFEVVADGFFPPEREAEVLDRLARLRPDILLVAMGVPRQEEWIARHLTAEHCTVAIGVGALLDFLSGAVPRAPGIVRRLRLEWLYRLSLEPRRLWRRYILGNPFFLARLIRQKVSRGARG